MIGEIQTVFCKQHTLALADGLFTDSKAGQGTSDGHAKDVENWIRGGDAEEKTLGFARMGKSMLKSNWLWIREII